MYAWFVSKGRRLSIRARIVSTLVVFFILPLSLGLVAVDYLAYQRFRAAMGRAEEERAAWLARQVQQVVETQIDTLEDWLSLLAVRRAIFSEFQLRTGSAQAPSPDEIASLESHWETLPAYSPEVLSVLHNPPAALLRDFQTRHPQFLQMEFSDRFGRLLAATQKPPSFHQCGTPWWPTLRPDTPAAELTTLRRREDAYLIDLIIPFRERDDPEAEWLGVLHAVLNPPDPNHFPGNGHDRSRAELLLHPNSAMPPLQPSGDNLPLAHLAPLREILAAPKAGWAYSARNEAGAEQLLAVAPLPYRFSQGLSNPTTKPPQGTPELSIVTSRPAPQFQPYLGKQIPHSGSLFVALIVGCSLLGYALTDRALIAPLIAFSKAARTLAARTCQTFPSGDTTVPLAELDRLTELGATAEIRQLAEDFRFLAEQVLNRHQLLEAEVAEKTAELNRDLQVAREFQEALLPMAYPVVPSPGLSAEVQLEFHHIYRPARTVGGDFFDVLALDDYRAGIFIADVMGHGARSALVTSILHTLLHGLEAETSHPAALLALVNQRFHALLRAGSDPVFVTAFYLIIDTRTRELRFASAGHPSPLLLAASNASTRDLLDGRPDPALGILPHTQYRTHHGHFAPGDLIFLFTDGIHEACSLNDEEFGLARLRSTVSQSRATSGAALNWTVLDAVLSFTKPAQPPDDICLVSILAMPTKGETNSAESQQCCRTRGMERAPGEFCP